MSQQPLHQIDVEREHRPMRRRKVRTRRSTSARLIVPRAVSARVLVKKPSEHSGSSPGRHVTFNGSPIRNPATTIIVPTPQVRPHRIHEVRAFVSKSAFAVFPRDTRPIFERSFVPDVPSAGFTEPIKKMEPSRAASSIWSSTKLEVIALALGGLVAVIVAIVALVIGQWELSLLMIPPLLAALFGIVLVAGASNLEKGRKSG